MDYRILGPVEVWHGAAPVNLGGAKQRALLALLLLHANHVVATERIVDELWGDTHPETAANAVQVYVANLRKVLQPERVQGAASDVILTRAPGYLLRVQSDEVDLLRFEGLTAVARRVLASDPQSATALLLEALQLWRGPALADIVFEGPARGEITRLGELRLAAQEDRIQGDLELGRHAALVGELEALVATHPLRERLHAQLMLALYRCGRQAEALKAYRDARRMLIDELGIEPCVELQSLEKAILVQDPALTAPTWVAPAPHPALAAPTWVAPAPHPWQPPVTEDPGATWRLVPQPMAPVEGGPPPARSPHTVTPGGGPARETAAIGASAPASEGTRPPYGRGPRVLLLAATALLVLGSTGGLILHSRGGGGAAPGIASTTTTDTTTMASPTASCAPAMADMAAVCSTPDSRAYPTSDENQLLAILPDFIDRSTRCHRTTPPYNLARADITCDTSGDPAHPGASKVMYQLFAHYKDLEEHFNHQAFLHQVAGAAADPNPACRASPSAATLGTYPENGVSQVHSSHGHFYCQKNAQGIPYVAWTNVAWLVVAEAVGAAPGDAAEAQLIQLWRFLGPMGDPPPQATPDAEVNTLYDLYLSRKPESAQAIAYWIDKIRTSGDIQARHDFVYSCEVRLANTLGVLDPPEKSQLLAQCP